MTLQKWIKDRAIHGYPTFSIEDVRNTGMYSSEQILQNELSRLCANKTIANVYRGFYVIFPVHYILRGSIPASYYIDQLMSYLGNVTDYQRRLSLLRIPKLEPSASPIHS